MDRPVWSGACCLADLDALGLDRPTTQAFVHDNGAMVFGLPL